MNNVSLAGRVATDIDTRTVGDMQVAKFRMAVDNRFSKKKPTDFFEVEAWGKTAEVIGQHAQKGAFVLIEGRLKEDNWETEDGSKRSKVLVNVNNFEFGPKTNKDEGSGSGGEKASAKKEKKKEEPEEDDDDIF